MKPYDRQKQFTITPSKGFEGSVINLVFSAFLLIYIETNNRIKVMSKCMERSQDFPKTG